MFIDSWKWLRSCLKSTTSVKFYKRLFMILFGGVVFLNLLIGSGLKQSNENTEITNNRWFQSLEINQKASLKIISEGNGSSSLESFAKTGLQFVDVCDTLIKDTDKNLVKKLQKLQVIRKNTSLDFYSDVTKDCDKFTSQMGYITDSSSQEEKDFPIAFGILVFKDLDQVERLLRAIYRPHNVHCIHIDSKSSIEFYMALKSIVSCLPNVWIASKHVDVRWGTFTVLEPEIVCLRELYAHKTKWRYYINLTGQEFPLKTNYELVKILKSYQGANDILGQTNILNSNRVDPKNPPPHNIKVCKGSVHMTASRAFIHYVLFNQTAQDFLKWSKNMSVPDESFFTSLNNNPHLKVPGSYIGDVEDNKRQELSRYKIWYNTKRCRSGHLYRSICIFGMADLPILTTKPQLFANKFHYEFEPLAYDCLELWYRRKINKELKGEANCNVDFYRNATFVKYRLVLRND